MRSNLSCLLLVVFHFVSLAGDLRTLTSSHEIFYGGLPSVEVNSPILDLVNQACDPSSQFFKFGSKNDIAFLHKISSQKGNISSHPKKGKTTYILLARPGGALGTQVNKFWSDVKAQKLANPAVLDYHPHITLTGFFSIKSPVTESKLKSALKNALNAAKVVPIAIKGTSIKKTKSLDYIPFKNSSALKAIAADFLHRAKVNKSYIKPSSNSNIGYHLTLRQNTTETVKKKVRELEDKDINLAATNLNKKTTWKLYIYKKIGSKMSSKPLYYKTIKTH